MWHLGTILSHLPGRSESVGELIFPNRFSLQFKLFQQISVFCFAVCTFRETRNWMHCRLNRTFSRCACLDQAKPLVLEASSRKKHYLAWFRIQSVFLIVGVGVFNFRSAMLRFVVNRETLKIRWFSREAEFQHVWNKDCGWMMVDGVIVSYCL